MRKSVIVAMVILALAFFLAGQSSVWAGEEKKQKNDASKEEKPYVYTNDDLTKYAEKDQEIATGEEEATYESVEETIKKIQAPEDLQKWKEARIKAAEEKVKAAERELDYLKKKKASIQNPFLPRPEPTEKDQQEEASMNNVKRLERTEKQIEEAETNLKAAEEDLEKLKQEIRDAGI